MTGTMDANGRPLHLIEDGPLDGVRDAPLALRHMKQRTRRAFNKGWSRGPQRGIESQRQARVPVSLPKLRCMDDEESAS